MDTQSSPKLMGREKTAMRLECDCRHIEMTYCYWMCYSIRFQGSASMGQGYEGLVGVPCDSSLYGDIHATAPTCACCNGVLPFMR